MSDATDRAGVPQRPCCLVDPAEVVCHEEPSNTRIFALGVIEDELAMRWRSSARAYEECEDSVWPSGSGISRATVYGCADLRVALG